MDYHTIKNWRFDEVVHHYDEKDAMLYALGVGLGADPLDTQQLRYVYERDLQTLPTFATVLGHPGFWMKDPRAGIDWVRVVHGEQRLRIHAPLPAQGTVISKARVTHVIDKGADKGALVVTERSLHDDSDALLATLQQITFCRGDGGLAKSDTPLPPLSAPPDNAPQRTCNLSVAPNAALLYRLNADPNPLHADPEVAQSAGYPRPILHGLCTYGMAAHALIKTWCDYDASRLRSIDARFSAAVYPGETLQCDMWRADERTLRFVMRAVERNVVVLSHGTATLAESGRATAAN